MNKNDKLYGLENQDELDTSLEEVIQKVFDYVSCPGDTVDQSLSRMTWPVNVCVFRRVDLSTRADRIASSILEDLLENLDEDNSDPNGDGTEPTDSMKYAARQFVSKVLSEYVSWACERTGEVVEVTLDQAKRMV